MIKRKYGARNVLLQQEIQKPVKRQRIQDEPSSHSVHISSRVQTSSARRTTIEAWLKPARPTIRGSSSPVLDVETPPLSPPPAATQCDPESPQLLKIRKPTFSFLRKQTSKALTVSLSESRSSANIPAAKVAKDTKLTQLTIDLGGPTTISCPDCQMSYTPSQPDDFAIHTKHHAAHLAKLHINTEAWKTVTATACWKDLGTREYIIAIASEDKASLRNLAERVLGIAARDLGAVEIDKAQLWTKGRYRVFLHCRDRKCAGLLLAEQIDSAHEIVEPHQDDGAVKADAGASLELAKSSVPAKLGVSRIWTCASARRSGIAIKLLEAARCNFMKRSKLSKTSMAFSQPTEMGTELARKWFAKQYGWSVYRE